MPERLELHEVDRDGAVREAAHRVATDAALEEAAGRGDTRAALLRRAALGGGLLGGGLLLALPAIGAGADTRSAKQDLDILNFALTLEYLEAAFYAGAVATGYGGEPGRFARTVAAHEQAHVDFLAQVLGSRALRAPAFDFKGANTGAVGTFLSTAVVLEDTGVAAYLGQVYRLQSTAFILAGASIHAVEARHSAWARSLVPSRVPSEEAFQPRATMSQVRKVVAGTGFVRG